MNSVIRDGISGRPEASGSLGVPDVNTWEPGVPKPHKVSGNKKMERLLKEAEEFVDTDSKGRRRDAPAAHIMLSRTEPGNVYCNLVSLVDSLELDEQQMKEESLNIDLNDKWKDTEGEYLQLIDAKYEAMFLI